MVREKHPGIIALQSVLRFLALVMSWFTGCSDLQTSVHYWQRELKLQEWNVSIQLVSGNELDKSTVGDVEPDRVRKIATLRILRQEEYALPEHLSRADQQLTVVHEMVHLRRFAAGDAQWASEGVTNAEVKQLVTKHRRWHELLVLE